MTQLSAAELTEVLKVVLDRLLPEDGAFASGGTVALDHVAGVMSDDARLARCLAAISAHSLAQHNTAFVALTEPLQVAVLQQVEQSEPQLFSALLVQAYSGYYSSPRTVHALGLPPGPPSKRPHRLEPLDPSRLDVVAARGPIYRPV